MLSLEHLALTKTGPTVSVELVPGGVLGIVGPAASGKSQMLAAIAGREKPARGNAKFRGEIALATMRTLPRRARAQSLIRSAETNVQARTMSCLRLWEVRQKTISQLSESQVAALILAEGFCQRADLLAIDGCLELLDPWTFHGFETLLLDRKMHGLATIVATNSIEAIKLCDTIILLQDQKPIFVGPPADLIDSTKESELTVITGNRGAVEAIVRPFRVSIRDCDVGVEIEAAEGQDLAAKLLCEGYGQVKSVLIRRQTLQEALIERLK